MNEEQVASLSGVVWSSSAAILVIGAILLSSCEQKTGSSELEAELVKSGDSLESVQRKTPQQVLPVAAAPAKPPEIVSKFIDQQFVRRGDSYFVTSIGDQDWIYQSKGGGPYWEWIHPEEVDRLNGIEEILYVCISPSVVRQFIDGSWSQWMNVDSQFGAIIFSSNFEYLLLKHRGRWRATNYSSMVYGENVGGMLRMTRPEALVLANGAPDPELVDRIANASAATLRAKAAQAKAVARRNAKERGEENLRLKATTYLQDLKHFNGFKVEAEDWEFAVEVMKKRVREEGEFANAGRERYRIANYGDGVGRNHMIAHVRKEDLKAIHEALETKDLARPRSFATTEGKKITATVTWIDHYENEVSLKLESGEIIKRRTSLFIGEDKMFLDRFLQRQMDEEVEEVERIKKRNKVVDDIRRRGGSYVPSQIP